MRGWTAEVQAAPAVEAPCLKQQDRQALERTLNHR